MVFIGFLNHRISTESDISVLGMFDEIKSMKKENLKLKMKIYFLEEKLEGKAQTNQECCEIIEENMNLNSELEHYSKEIERKNGLIEETIIALDEYEMRVKLLGLCLS